MTHSGEVASEQPLAMADDLSREVSIGAQLDKSGLSMKARSRAVSTLDQLVGGVVGIPAAYLEGVRSRTAQRSRHRVKLLETAQKVEIAQIEAANRLEQIAIDHLIT